MTRDNSSPEENGEENKNVATMQLVIFELANEEYGVEITDLQEIIKLQDITPIPNSPDFINGIIDLRGKIAVVMDLKKRFGLNGVKEESKEDKEKRILVADINGNIFGLIVDKVAEVKKTPLDSVKKTPELVTNKIHAEYLKGVSVLEERLILLLDLTKVLAEKELAELSELGAATMPKKEESSDQAAEDEPVSN